MIKRSIVWTFLFIAAGNGAGSKCYGQETDIQQSIESFTLQAMKYESMDNLDSASYFYQQLAKTYYENGQIDEYFNNYTNIADLFIKKGSYETAIQWLDSAGNQPFPTYPNENERLAMLEWYLFKAYCYEQQSDYVTAKSIYEAAQLNLVTEEIHEDYYVAQFLYQPLGNIYTRLGDYAAATNLLTKFKTISEEAGDLNAVAQATNDLGIVLKILQRYDEATENYLSALKYRNLDLATSGLLKSNLASTYLETNQPKNALQFANQAIVDFDRTLKNGNQTAQVFSYLAWTYNIIGQIYAFLEQYDQARNYYEESLNLSTQLFRTNKRREIAKINIGLGELALSTSDVERSMHHFQQALISVVPQFNNIDPANNPPDDQLLPENALFEALEGKARAYKLLYLSTGKLENLKYVVANYQLIRKVEVMIRQSYQNESSKLLLSGESHARSESALEAVHELYQLTGEDVYIEEAYQIIESNKATILLESIKDLKLKSFANIPDWILEREEILKNKQYSLQKLLSDALRENQSDSQSLKEIRSKLFQNKRALDLLNEKLKTDFPNYYLLKNEINLVNSLTDIKNQFIDETTDMIEYFVGDQNIFIIHISHEAVVFHQINHDFPLISQVIALNNMIMDENPAQSDPMVFNALANEIYSEIIQPIQFKTNIKQLYIIPDGILGYLSFETLTKSVGEDKNRFNVLDYLINSYSISYAFSCQILFENVMHEVKHIPPKQYLGMAPGFKESNQYAYLPFSKSEVENIQLKFGGDIYTDSQATKSRFKEIAEEYRVLHISSHAAVADSLPLYSWISFSDRRQMGVDAHRLYLVDLYAMHLQAELAVLSACETGRGQFNRGEGIMSLARGFAYAGCQSIITTLWPVNDGTTSIIMEEFFKNLKNGESKSDALHQAKLAYLHNNTVDDIGAHPFFWAAYIAVGNMNPIKTEYNWLLFLWIASGFIFLTLILIYIRKYKKIYHA